MLPLNKLSTPCRNYRGLGLSKNYLHSHNGKFYCTQENDKVTPHIKKMEVCHATKSNLNEQNVAQVNSGRSGKISSIIIAAIVLIGAAIILYSNNIQPKIDEAKKMDDHLVDQIIKEAMEANPFVIEAEKVKEILSQTGLMIDQLLDKLIPIAKTFARPPISNYRVGEAVLGKSGRIYLGVNVELLEPLNQSIHGEQFLIALLHHYGDEPLRMALPAAPCGHCRQFLNELGDAKSLVILTPGNPPATLEELLPKSFGPKDLGIEGGLLASAPISLSINSQDPLALRAKDAACKSYAPYTKALSGAAIKTKDGKIYSGSYLENVAFNPSLSPFHSALVLLIADGRSYEEIEKVALAELNKAVISQAPITAIVLKTMTPHAKLSTYTLKDISERE